MFIIYIYYLLHTKSIIFTRNYIIVAMSVQGISDDGGV